MKRKAIFLILVITLTTMTGCQSTKYVERSSSKDTKSLGPIVTFTRAGNFDFDSLDCVAVGVISDQSASDDFSGIDRLALLRSAVYGHLAPKMYRDIEPGRVDFIFNKHSDLPTEQILDKLECDALLTGQITKFENKYLLAYSVTSIGLKLRLEHKTGQEIWSSEHIARSSSGAIPLSPIGLATGLFLAANNAEEEVAFQMVDTVVRRSLNALPNRSHLVLTDNIIEVSIAGSIQVGKEVSDSDPIEDALIIGDYEQALTLAEEAISREPKIPDTYYKGGRALLGLGNTDQAVDYFYEAVALDEQEDRYLEALGAAYIKMDKPDLALASFKRAISINEHNSFAYFNAAVIFENDQRYSKAAEFYHRAGIAGMISEDYKRVRRSVKSLGRLPLDLNDLEKLAELELLFETRWPELEENVKVQMVSNLAGFKTNQ